MKHLNKKSTASYLYQRFLSIDPRMRKKLIVGAGLVLVVGFTGVFLILASLVRFGGELLAEYKAPPAVETSRYN